MQEQLSLEQAWNTLLASIDAAMNKGGFGGIQQNKTVIVCFEKVNSVLLPLINEENTKKGQIAASDNA